MDILPTLIDLCELPRPGDVAFDGRSLTPLLKDPDQNWPPRTFVVETQRTEPTSIKWKNSAVMTDRWRLVNGQELYDIEADPGQQSNVADWHPDVAARLKQAYEDYWAQVKPGDREFARPTVGTRHQQEIVLTGEEFRPIEGHNACAWNQAHVAGGMAAFGYAEIKVARASEYRFELRRWPRELDAPIAGVPTWTKPVNAWIHNKPITAMLYGDKFRSLPVKRIQLKIDDELHEAEVTPADSAKVFTVPLPEGAFRLETTMLDDQGEPLAEAYYVYIRPGKRMAATENSQRVLHPQTK
jgi:hypothetical protein